MDNFMDKIAQKFSTQDIMKANASAEAAEIKNLQMQLSEYETLLGNMRQVNLKNVTMTESMEGLLQQLQGAMATLELKQHGDIDGFARQREQLDIITKAVDAIIEKLQEEDKVEEVVAEELQEDAINQEQLKEEELKEHIHTESVKVYRNVQAVIGQGLKELEKSNQVRESKLKVKLRTIKGCAVACVVLLAINLVITVVNFAMNLLVNIFGFTFF